MSDDKKDINLNLSKETQCPYDENHKCERRANYIANYANYLTGLAKSGSHDIFTNGDGRFDKSCDQNCTIWKAHNGKQR